MARKARGFGLVGVKAGDPVAKIWGYGSRHTAANLAAPLSGRLFFDAHQQGPADMDRWIRVMKVVRPRLIYGYATAVQRLARHVAEAGRSLPDLAIVATTAEKLFPEAREEIEASLGARVIDVYGCAEVPPMASECLHGSLHIFSDAAVVELLGDGVDPLGSRQIAVTSLVSWAQPFIRYVLGDAGRPLEGACSCGLPFPRMAMDVGKVHYLFHFPGGEQIHSAYFHERLFTLDALDLFQIRHIRPEALEVLAVPRRGREEQARVGVEAAVEGFRKRLGPRVTVLVRWVDHIERIGRKRSPVISRVDEDHGRGP